MNSAAADAVATSHRERCRLMLADARLVPAVTTETTVSRSLADACPALSPLTRDVVEEVP